jgi:hypothetical protein
VFSIVLCLVEAKTSNNSKIVCESFEIGSTISTLDDYNCSSLQFKITASREKFSVFFRVRNDCEWNNSTRYQLLFVWKHEIKREIVVKLEPEKINKVHQKLTIDKDYLYRLMVDSERCKIIQHVAAFGDLYLFQNKVEFDSENEIETDKLNF